MEIKDKPSTMGVREWITKKVAVEVVIPENVIKRVVTHQFDSAYEALENNNNIELSGFGKFYYNTKKAEKEIIHTEKQKATHQARYVSEGTTEKERLTLKRDIEHLEKKLEWLYKKKE